MTTIEARKMMNLKEDDKLSVDGILSLIRGVQEYLGVWSISKFDRQKAEKELEALITLYAEAIK